MKNFEFIIIIRMCRELDAVLTIEGVIDRVSNCISKKKFNDTFNSWILYGFVRFRFFREDYI